MAVHLVDHPLAQDALMTLRDAATAAADFRRATRRISLLLAAEALRDVATAPARVETPMGKAEGHRVRVGIVVVPILRAGLGMLEAVLELVPEARVGHVGLQRDEETAVASQYYAKLPPALGESVVLIIDPMLATGGSAVAAIDLVKNAGARDVRLACIIAARPGVSVVQQHHPDVTVYTPAIDATLDPRKFIVPGLGDFGDRLYSTI